MNSSTVWMGGLTSEMDSAFIIGAFANMGYTALSVKEINDKGERANYCFVDFGDVNVAREVVIKINNQPIPGVTGNKKFRLNRSEYGRSSVGETEYSLFVGDLSPDVSDDVLLDFFRLRYKSVRVAKVCLDENGYAKGYGFVRFFDSKEFQTAIHEMNGASGLGTRKIRVNKALKSRGNAAPSAAPAAPTPSSSSANPDFMDPSMIPGFMQLQMQYMQQMQDYMAQCHQYAQQAAACAGWINPDQPAIPPPQAPPFAHAAAAPIPAQVPAQPISHTPQTPKANADGSVLTFIQQQHEQLVSEAANAALLPEDEELVDPNPPIDIIALNQAIIDRDDQLFFQLEESRWCAELAVFGVKEQRPLKMRKENVILID